MIMNIYALFTDYDPNRDVHVAYISHGLERLAPCALCNARRTLPHDPLEGVVANAFSADPPQILPCAHIPYLIMSEDLAHKCSERGLTLPPVAMFHAVVGSPLHGRRLASNYLRVLGESDNRCMLDLNRSGFSRWYVCDACGTVNHNIAETYTARRYDKRYVVISDTVPDLDVFTTQLSPTLFLCTEGFRRVCESIEVERVSFEAVLRT